jgi:hypothetical protein
LLTARETAERAAVGQDVHLSLVCQAVVSTYRP